MFLICEALISTRLCVKSSQCPHTANVTLGAVHHISSVDELVAWAFRTQLQLSVAEEGQAPAEKRDNSNRWTAVQFSLSSKPSSSAGSGQRYEAPAAVGPTVPAVHGNGCEIQLVFALEEEHFRPDLHNRRGVDGHGYAEQRQMRSVPGLAVPHALLAVQELQPPPELQSLE